jgi:hypothetical protein
MERAGFRFGARGTHGSRTIMLRELTELFAAVPPGANRSDHTAAIVDENALGKPTYTTRLASRQRLIEMYSLDPRLSLFRVLRHLWRVDPGGRPLLAMLAALARDPLLRTTAAPILGLATGEELVRSQFAAVIRAAVGSRLNDAVLDKVARNAASSWAQSGHLKGRVRKIRRRVVPTPGAAAMALWLGHIEGRAGLSLLRSYLVGEIHAEWLDEDEGEDLVTTDRQDILWESDYGRAFRKWGAEWIRKIGAASRKPRRRRVEQLFLTVSDLKAKASTRFADEAIVATAVELGKQIGRFAAEDELSDTEYVEGLTEVVLSVAPHKALMDAFDEFNRRVFGNEVGMESLLDLFSKTRVAEMASYAQIAYERVKAIRKLEGVLDDDGAEEALQGIVAEAPWLIEATWTPITKNQSLKLFARNFAEHYKRHYGQEVVLAIDHSRKRPDFTLVNVSRKIHVVEIKAAGHAFGNRDWVRLHNYLEAFESFSETNAELMADFPDGWVVDLICDSLKIRDRDKRAAYEHWRQKNRIETSTWRDFLKRAVTAN